MTLVRWRAVGVSPGMSRPSRAFNDACYTDVTTESLLIT